MSDPHDSEQQEGHSQGVSNFNHTFLLGTPTAVDLSSMLPFPGSGDLTITKQDDDFVNSSGRRSSVWRHFKQKSNSETMCIYCNRILKFDPEKKSTSSMKKHIAHCTGLNQKLEVVPTETPDEYTDTLVNFFIDVGQHAALIENDNLRKLLSVVYKSNAPTAHDLQGFINKRYPTEDGDHVSVDLRGHLKVMCDGRTKYLRVDSPYRLDKFKQVVCDSFALPFLGEKPMLELRYKDDNGDTHGILDDASLEMFVFHTMQAPKRALDVIYHSDMKKSPNPKKRKRTDEDDLPDAKRPDLGPELHNEDYGANGGQ